jgi:hypothetical protein
MLYREVREIVRVAEKECHLRVIEDDLVERFTFFDRRRDGAWPLLILEWRAPLHGGRGDWIAIFPPHEEPTEATAAQVRAYLDEHAPLVKPRVLDSLTEAERKRLDEWGSRLEAAIRTRP